MPSNLTSVYNFKDSLSVEPISKDPSLKRSLLMAGMSFFILLAYVDLLMTALGLALCVFSFAFFINRLGRTVPVLELMLFMASLQWIFSPYISYVLEFEHFKYIMYVDQNVYMKTIVPGYFSFLAGVLLFIKNPDFDRINREIGQLANKNPKIAYYLIAVGLILPFLNPIIPLSLRFVVFLLSSLKYIGVAMLFFQKGSRQKWQSLVVVMGLTLISSLQIGMFHDLILWSALLFSFVAIHLKLTNFTKFIIIAGAFFFTFLLQGIKSEYRTIISASNLTNTEKVDVFFDLLFGQFDSGEDETSDSYLGMINVRLNQGWIISAIIYNVPDYEPFADGETIYEALYASFVPRFLDPDKKRAGGQENFERFTGLPIRDDTSMGTSIIGEAYGNYGLYGSWIFMFIWGVALSLGYRFLIGKIEKRPFLYLFLPLIFLQVIKAETEFSVVLNHFIKSLVLVFVLLWFARKYLKWPV